MRNEMEIYFDAVSDNEAFARIAVAAFLVQQNPTLEEISDIKTAVSEAVTNAIIHGYENYNGYGGTNQKNGDGRESPGKIRLKCILEEDELRIEIEDSGKGIENIDLAMEPLYTSKPELERSGMGFAFMEAFMDSLEVVSEAGKGTIVFMKKKIGNSEWIDSEE